MEKLEKKVEIKCPNCFQTWHQKVIEDKLIDAQCKCGVQLMMQETKFDQVIVQFSMEAHLYIKLDIEKREHSIVKFL